MGMTEKMIQQIMNATENVAMVTLALKAKGGYKFRQKINMDEHDLDAFIAKSDGILLRTVVSLLVAEHWIDFQTGRLHLYKQEVEDAMTYIREHRDEFSKAMGLPVEEVPTGE
jgi:uncharacterized protein (DUF2164 family)